MCVSMGVGVSASASACACACACAYECVCVECVLNKALTYISIITGERDIIGTSVSNCGR